MNRAEVLAATAAFLVADHEYVTLIRKALVIHGSRLPVPLTDAVLREISEAKRIRAGLEEKMYGIWTSNGIG